MTLGLFAKHVVIPFWDGDKAESDFRSLLREMHREFQPEGVYEEWLLLRIAQCMWRLKRATRCENGAIREADSSAPHRNDEGNRILDVACEVSILAQAEKQLVASGTLTQKLYTEVVPLVEKERERESRLRLENTLVEANFDRQKFLAVIADHKRFLNSYFEVLCRSDEAKSDARSDYEALPQEDDLDRILRYEERMLGQLDWAQQRLSECQERRKRWSSGSRVDFLPSDENRKRSQ